MNMLKNTNRHLAAPDTKGGDTLESTTDEKETLLKYMRKIEVAEAHRDKGYRDHWERYYKRWRNHVDKLKEGEKRSNISVPYIFVQIETIIPRLVETLFAARPYVTIKGRKREFADNADKMQTLLDYQMNEVFDVQDNFHIGLKIMALYGTTVAYVGWKYRERLVIKKQLQPVMIDDGMGGQMPVTDPHPMTGEPIPVQDWQEAKVNETEYDDPEAKFLDLGLFYVDPNAEDIESARYCGHVCYHSKAELEDMKQQGIIKEIDWEQIPKDDKKNEARNRRMSAVGLPTDNAANTQHEDDNLYEVHYHWEDDKWVIIINRCYIARDSENPFWHKKKPYVKDTYTKVPNEFYGIGVVEIIEDQQDELNTERNMRIDYRAHNLRRMFKRRRGSNIDPKQMVWRQNGVIDVDAMADLEVFDPPSISGDTFNQEDIVKRDMQDATGAQDVVMGGSGAGETATTTMSKDNNASMRFKLIISSAEKRLLVGISRFMIQLNQQFVDNVRILPLFDDKGDDWPEITPEDIQGEFHLIAAGSSVEPMANKEAFKQRMVELYGMVVNDPFMQQYPDKRRNLLKKVLEAFDITDTEDLLPNDEELAGMMNDQAIQQFVTTLPPELQQLVMQFMQPSQPQGAPQDVSQVGGGANTAMQSERGLQVV